MGRFQEWWSVITAFFSLGGTVVDEIPSNLTFVKSSVIITGATSGLGLEAAILYVQLGASPVIITARTATRGLEAKSTIEQRTGKKDVVQVRILDMDTFDGVKSFVNGLRKDVKSIDIVLLNAGLHNFNYQKLPEGWEGDLQVNVLSTALLGLLMLQWMRQVRNPEQTQHLGLVSSGSHISTANIQASNFPRRAILSFWNMEENFASGRQQYGTSKLLQQYTILEIAKLAVDEHGKPSPIVNSVCPGLIKTNIAREFAAKSFIHKAIASLFMWLKGKPAAFGARSLVLLGATGPEEHGKFKAPYITDVQYESRSEKNIASMEGQKVQAQVWKEIIRVLEPVDPEVVEIVRL